MGRETSQSTIDKIETCFGWCRDKTLESDSYFDDWENNDYWYNLHVPWCLRQLWLAVEATNKGIRYLLNRDPSYDYNFLIPYWMDAFGGGDITLEAMIEAVINSDTPDMHRKIWVLIWDAYRATMYEKSFNLTFHQYWVRMFKSWT